MHYIVCVWRGEYEDRESWISGVYHSEAEARQECERLAGQICARDPLWWRAAKIEIITRGEEQLELSHDGTFDCLEGGLPEWVKITRHFHPSAPSTWAWCRYE